MRSNFRMLLVPDDPNCPPPPDGEDAPVIYWESLEGMKMRAVHYLANHRTKGEKRMAKDVLALVAWVEAEGKANQKALEHKFELTVSGGSRNQAELAVLSSFAQRRPDGFEFHLNATPPPKF